MHVTGGNEMTNKIAIGTSQPNFKLEGATLVFISEVPPDDVDVAALTCTTISLLVSTSGQFVCGIS